MHAKTYEAMVGEKMRATPKKCVLLQAIRAFPLTCWIVCRDLACFFTLSYLNRRRLCCFSASQPVKARLVRADCYIQACLRCRDLHHRDSCLTTCRVVCVCMSSGSALLVLRGKLSDSLKRFRALSLCKSAAEAAMYAIIMLAAAAAVASACTTPSRVSLTCVPYHLPL